VYERKDLTWAGLALKRGRRYRYVARSTDRAQQVEHSTEQLRCIISDLIVEERERTKASIEELRQQLFERVKVDHKKVSDLATQKVVDVVTQIINEGVGRVFDRVNAKLTELDQRLAASMRRFDDGDGRRTSSGHGDDHTLSKCFLGKPRCQVSARPYSLHQPSAISS
jgi:excinuclease UvrABC ATPase subunit